MAAALDLKDYFSFTLERVKDAHQLASRVDRCAIHLVNNIAPLQAGVGRRSVGINVLDNDTAAHLQLELANNFRGYI